MGNALESLRGKLLLDGGELAGSFFARTVVLICQHDAEGAFGLVLNRPSGKHAGELLVADLPEVLEESPVFVGGPVQTNALSYLHTDTFLPNASILPNLEMGHSLEELMSLGESFSSAMKVRLFAGYAGWAPGQLDKEMRAKAWLTHPASLSLVFETAPEALWQVILRQKESWKCKVLSEMPEDPSLN
jgi:putative transcriptional regulator